jgi:hypothetical protein
MRGFSMRGLTIFCKWHPTESLCDERAIFANEWPRRGVARAGRLSVSIIFSLGAAHFGSILKTVTDLSDFIFVRSGFECRKTSTIAVVAAADSRKRGSDSRVKNILRGPAMTESELDSVWFCVAALA